MRKTMMILVALIAATMSTMSFAQSSGYQKLDEWTGRKSGKTVSRPISAIPPTSNRPCTSSMNGTSLRVWMSLTSITPAIR